MMIQKYEVAGGDGGPYGAVFGPLIGEEIEEIHGPQNDYLLLKLSPPLVVESTTTDYMLVSPRYKGDTLKKLKRKGCAVGVFRVLAGKQEDVRNGVSRENVDYWAVGDCKPVK